MSTGSWLAADLVVAVLAAAGWLGAGAAAAAGRRRTALGLGLFALLATAGRTVTVLALARAGWWFAAEKVVIAAPLCAAAVVVAVWSRRPVALFFAGYAAGAAVLVTVLHGYPVSAATGLLAVAGVAAATALTWRLLGPRPSPAVARATVVVAVAALVAGTGLAATAGAAPPVRHDHGPVASPAVGKPTKRFILTAAVDGDTWAFNGQVPGPALEATVGDVLEVTLRNRDIERGVTLHWHGYDVPNSQDGVPGVTQAAVLPGQEFVYLFAVDQAGTYWYHTHSASDPAVRKGLYGVLVVRPGPPRGVDVTLPVHTLAGRLLPAPATRPVAPGTPVRLRLINTDSTTHRYALAGAPFRVVAIDGVDLHGPASLAGTALSIPAGGRYDLAFTGAGALYVDGRLTYATGPVTADTGGWPVLDPLTYGSPLSAPPPAPEPAPPASSRAPGPASPLPPPGSDLAFPTPTAPDPPSPTPPPASDSLSGRAATAQSPMPDPLTHGAASPVPWSRFDREFTLVLDRGADLRGLLPRYAHTVNGAADPDIPVQQVRRGEVVMFTIVNRSLTVHPWHLHGHHVLVLSRNGRPATGSPLWLDSFDVRPGEVWKVAFRADNPGVWANHCHNLPHADAGMMLHLMYV
ncbi:multicopper oxidase family protein [Actinoplanes sp. URMC 104]|uniref:multicopper oxidase family protein n=1 Tax=Actinoplanes sp. URMC 104 TaxID=3423409 RepID=UPI003F1ABC2E